MHGQKYIGAIDQGTTSSRFFLFDENGKLAPGTKIEKVEFKDFKPHPGWLEHDPMVILDSVYKAIENGMKDRSLDEIAAIGVTNQRETTILWDKYTGKPLHNAIVWSDTRTTRLVDKLKLELGEDYFTKSCGLPLANYFSAMKIKWLMENVRDVEYAIIEERCLFGTVDSWIIWNLTGGAKTGVHVTDITNASRTMLMNLKTLDWDHRTCQKLGIPIHILPKIKASSTYFGKIAFGPLAGVQIMGCIGDQQAATLGQLCLTPGTSKGTYGTGCFMLMNTGHDILFSKNKMLTTALFQLGENEKPFYALEGAIAACGSTIEWLKEDPENPQAGLALFPKKSTDINEMASRVLDTGGVYLVNAFSGLLAPRWRSDARGTIVGMTFSTNRFHICRAVFESIAFSSKEIVDSMERDSKVKLTLYKIDGGVSNSDLLAQYLSDFLGIPVARPEMRETTALGAAMAAGLAVGVWKDTKDLQEKIGGNASYGKEFVPQIERKIIDQKFYDWNRAVERALGWIESEERIKQTETIIWKHLPALLGGIAIGSILTFSAMKFFKH